MSMLQAMPSSSHLIPSQNKKKDPDSEEDVFSFSSNREDSVEPGSPAKQLPQRGVPTEPLSKQQAHRGNRITSEAAASLIYRGGIVDNTPASPAHKGPHKR
jgi:hypothetical protein